MSERSFTRIFRQETGTAPADFVEITRVDAAKRLLEGTSLPVKHIATACGFSNPTSLRRAFRRRVGTGPSDYRLRFGFHRRL